METKVTGYATKRDRRSLAIRLIKIAWSLYRDKAIKSIVLTREDKHVVGQNERGLLVRRLTGSFDVILKVEK